MVNKVSLWTRDCIPMIVAIMAMKFVADKHHHGILYTPLKFMNFSQRCTNVKIPSLKKSSKFLIGILRSWLPSHFGNAFLPSSFSMGQKYLKSEIIFKMRTSFWPCISIENVLRFPEMAFLTTIPLEKMIKLELLLRIKIEK